MTTGAQSTYIPCFLFQCQVAYNRTRSLSVGEPRHSFSLPILWSKKTAACCWTMQIAVPGPTAPVPVQCCEDERFRAPQHPPQRAPLLSKEQPLLPWYSPALMHTPHACPIACMLYPRAGIDGQSAGGAVAGVSRWPAAAQWSWHSRCVLARSHGAAFAWGPCHHGRWPCLSRQQVGGGGSRKDSSGHIMVSSCWAGGQWWHRSGSTKGSLYSRGST